ncbi:MAG: SDR family oxidoreductase [Dehalococcoidia bacterium]|nr:SDR family oxidoreductase [Dehalococcoidia bacterium]
MGSLDGRVALVTGAGPNIGGAIAKLLAANGAKVGCLDMKPDVAASCADGINAAGGAATPLVADITNEAQVEKAVAQLVGTFGSLDILVNNVAISLPGNLLDLPLEHWRRNVDVILTGTFLCSRYGAKQMIAQGKGGAIVNIANASSHRGRAGSIGYVTSKGGVLTLTRVLAIELAPHHIRVNSVSPTATGVALVSGQRHDRSGPPKGIPLGRFGEPGDVASAVLYLASPAADYVTGIDIPVEGGSLAVFAT